MSFLLKKTKSILLLKQEAGLVEQEINLCALSDAQIILAEKNDELARQCRIDHLTRRWNKSAPIKQYTKLNRPVVIVLR